MNFWTNIFLDNEIGSLITVLAIILIFFLFKKWFAHSAFSIIFNRVNKKWKNIDRSVFHKLVILPLSSFITSCVAFIALSSLKFPSAWKFSLNDIQLHEVIQNIGKCIVIVYFILFAAKFVAFFSVVLEKTIKNNKDKSDDQLIVFFRDFLKVIIYIIGVLLVLKIAFHVNVGAILTGLSIVGAALALAAKESIENLIASFIIFFDKPFFTGDTVRVNNQQNTFGTVESIGLRSTRIRTIDQTLITVPNKQMVDSVVDNWSMRTSRRGEISIDLLLSNANEDIEKLISAFSAFIDKHPMVIKHQLYISNITQNGIVLFTEFFTGVISQEDYNKTRQSLQLELKNLLEATKLKTAANGNQITIIGTDIVTGKATDPII